MVRPCSCSPDLTNARLGEPAGTTFPPNSTQTADDMYRVFEHFVEVVKHDPRSKGKLVVTLIDGAKINKMLSDSAVNPSKVY